MTKFIFLMFVIYSSFAVSDEIDCNNIISTLDINYCAGVELKKAELEMTTYLAKSKEKNSDDKELITAIDKAQKAWEVYAEAHWLHYVVVDASKPKSSCLACSGDSPARPANPLPQEVGTSQDSSKGGAMEAGCSDLYDIMY